MTKREFFNKKREEYISFYNYLESPNYCLYGEFEIFCPERGKNG